MEPQYCVIETSPFEELLERGAYSIEEALTKWIESHIKSIKEVFNDIDFKNKEALQQSIFQYYYPHNGQFLMCKFELVKLSLRYPDDVVDNIKDELINTDLNIETPIIWMDNEQAQKQIIDCISKKVKCFVEEIQKILSHFKDIAIVEEKWFYLDFEDYFTMILNEDFRKQKVIEIAYKLEKESGENL